MIFKSQHNTLHLQEYEFRQIKSKTVFLDTLENEIPRFNIIAIRFDSKIFTENIQFLQNLQ